MAMADDISPNAIQPNGHKIPADIDEPAVMIDSDEPNIAVDVTETDGPSAHFRRMKNEDRYGEGYSENRNIAEGMMDLALLTANANQLRFLLTYNSQSSTFYISVGLVILSLLLQVAVGIALIFRHNTGRRSRKRKTNQIIIGGVFMVTFVNVLVAALTTTDNKNSN